MTILADTLATKNREAAAGAKLTIYVDSAATAETVTYTVKLEAPAYSEELLLAQTDVEVAAAVAEFTAWAAELW
jgi:hypothetical protein